MNHWIGEVTNPTGHGICPWLTQYYKQDMSYKMTENPKKI